MKSDLRLPIGFALLATLGIACSSASGPLGSSEEPDIGDAKSLVACPSNNSDPTCPTGSFVVTCANGSKEVDTKQQVLNNKVCLPPPDAGSHHDGGSHSDGGSHTDAGSPPSDPFDPQSCTGQAITQSQAAQLFPAGATESIVGSYTMVMRQRSCNAVTGCGSWGAPTTSLGTVLGGGTAPLSGKVVLDVQSTNIALTLADSTGYAPYNFGSTCSNIGGTTESCPTYSYNIGDQWGGSGGMYPTEGLLSDANGKDVALTGLLTAKCMRLASSITDNQGNVVQEFVVLSSISKGTAPPPSACPGGGTSMACGSQAAAGMTTCCGHGLTTCPQSGCDCWAECN
jgi:hypothetical protein